MFDSVTRRGSGDHASISGTHAPVVGLLELGERLGVAHFARRARRWCKTLRSKQCRDNECAGLAMMISGILQSLQRVSCPVSAPNLSRDGRLRQAMCPSHGALTRRRRHGGTNNVSGRNAIVMHARSALGVSTIEIVVPSVAGSIYTRRNRAGLIVCSVGVVVMELKQTESMSGAFADLRE